MNISEHTQNYIQEMRRRGMSENTIENYVSCIKLFFCSSKKDHPKNINEHDIKDFLSQFKEPNTQRNYHSAIKKFYEICLNQPNKFKYIPYCQKSQKLPIVLSVSEIQKMFSVCQNLKHKTILALLYSCGLRVSELINLQWVHIDRSRMIINILQGKGKKDRQVMLPPELLPLLEAYYKEYKPNKFVLNGQTPSTVLTYSQKSVGEVIKQLASKAGLNNKRVYTHLIRHCFATHLLEAGTDINLIQKLLGHSNVKTTMIYARVSHSLISQIPSPLKNINL
jgi:site-specific recombinase XerD